MTDLTDEALDALVARLMDGPSRVYRDIAAGKHAADAITALRAREATIVAAAFEVLCNVLHCCDTEAQAIANRISGPRGERNRCPDGVQVLEDAETIIRAAAALVTPSDSTAALARIVREAEARGMVKGMRNTFILLAEWADAEAAAILARAADMQKDAAK